MTTQLTQEQQDIISQLNSLSQIDDIFILFIKTNFLGETLKNSFVTAFQENAPQIANEILTLSLDPSCDCVNKIRLYVKVYPTQCVEILQNFITQNNLFDLLNSLYNAIEKNIPLVLSGKVAVTTIEGWSDFAKKIQSTVYSSFSTSLSGDKVLVFFS
jgi:hypothetical protein